MNCEPGFSDHVFIWHPWHSSNCSRVKPDSSTRLTNTLALIPVPPRSVPPHLDFRFLAVRHLGGRVRSSLETPVRSCHAKFHGDSILSNFSIVAFRFMHITRLNNPAREMSHLDHWVINPISIDVNSVILISESKHALPKSIVDNCDEPIALLALRPRTSVSQA
jgi:hypothetical protein